MLQRKKISKEICAVAHDPTEIQLRFSGKAHYGMERPVAEIKDGILFIYENIAEKFGIKIVIKNWEES